MPQGRPGVKVLAPHAGPTAQGARRSQHTRVHGGSSTCSACTPCGRGPGLWAHTQAPARLRDPCPGKRRDTSGAGTAGAASPGARSLGCFHLSRHRCYKSAFPELGQREAGAILGWGRQRPVRPLGGASLRTPRTSTEPAHRSRPARSGP